MIICENYSISFNFIEERRELFLIYFNCSCCGWLFLKCCRMGKEDGVKKNVIFLIRIVLCLIILNIIVL